MTLYIGSLILGILLGMNRTLLYIFESLTVLADGYRGYLMALGFSGLWFVFSSDFASTFTFMFNRQFSYQHLYLALYRIERQLSNINL